MDAFAAIGSLVISEGATAPLVLTTQSEQVQLPPEPPAITPADRQTVDAVFTTHPEKADYSVPATLLVVSASIATLKSIAIDEQKSHEEEEEEDLPQAESARREDKKKAKGSGR